jgi:hypothetical protein
MTDLDMFLVTIAVLGIAATIAVVRNWRPDQDYFNETDKPL